MPLIKVGDIVVPQPVDKPDEFEQSFELTIPGNRKFYFATAEDMQEAHIAISSAIREIADQLDRSLEE